MKLRQLVRVFAKISLVFTFIVIIAGSVVRMTGSGMGCPDWPKCFGHFVPPIDQGELTYKEGVDFNKGQMIIMNDTLWVANAQMKLPAVFDRSQWHKYPKHDYAIFNALHTWVEYVNRLATVLYAIPIMILSILSLILLIRERDRTTFLLAFFTDLMIAYEIWLGKLVVDGNLKENSITYHMFGSVAIVGLLLMLVYRHRVNRATNEYSTSFRFSVLAMLALAFLQVMLGTQVREEIDIVARVTPDRSVWIEQLPVIFKIHRSFSIVVTILAVFIFMQYRKMNFRIVQIEWMLGFVVMEIIAGVVLSYFSMPATLQPLHLLLGVLLFAATFYSTLRIVGNKKAVSPVE